MKHRLPLLLVRHAQADHHIQNITGGWTDTSLTETGHKQSLMLATRLSIELDGGPIRLGSSNLRRAIQTAAIIGRVLETTPQVFPALADLNNGLAAGKTRTEASCISIPPSEPVMDWQPYPQAESWRQFFQRVAGFMEEFSSHQAAPAILVTHAADIHVIVAWWLGMSVESRAQFKVAPASLTLLRINHFGEPSLDRLNDTAHLYQNGMPDPIRF